jgi:hypothetical protein
MTGFWDLDLIRLFELYLAVAFVASTAVRLRQYEAVVRLVFGAPERWPRLMKLVREHHGIFWTRATALPAVLALGLLLLHTLACRLVWPRAVLTLSGLYELRAALPFIGILTIAMLAVDLYATLKVGVVDRAMLERYFDQAEFWLRSWVAPVVRVFTLDYINPRRMVNVEVRKALEAVSRLLNTTLWWVTLQVSLRIAVGLALWLAYAFS